MSFYKNPRSKQKTAMNAWRDEIDFQENFLKRDLGKNKSIPLKDTKTRQRPQSAQVPKKIGSRPISRDQSSVLLKELRENEDTTVGISCLANELSPTSSI
jgi:hypothetical protein